MEVHLVIRSFKWRWKQILQSLLFSVTHNLKDTKNLYICVEYILFVWKYCSLPRIESISYNSRNRDTSVRRVLTGWLGKKDMKIASIVAMPVFPKKFCSVSIIICWLKFTAKTLKLQEPKKPELAKWQLSCTSCEVSLMKKKMSTSYAFWSLYH